MPVFTNTISNQNTATSGGIFSYPQIRQGLQYTTIMDQFQRETLNPTGTMALYSTGGVGTPNLTISNGNGLTIFTSSASNDNSALRTSGLTFMRDIITNYIDSRTQLNFNISWNSASTNQQFFIGLIVGSTQSILSALPTTVKHIGCYYNTAVDTHLRLSSSDGTTQTTTDCGAINTSAQYYLQFLWNGVGTGTLNLYTGTYPTLSTLIKSVNVANFGASADAYELHIFEQTLTTAVKQININSWSLSLT